MAAECAVTAEPQHRRSPWSTAGKAGARAYNRSEAIEKRRALMQVRLDHCDGRAIVERSAIRSTRTNLSDQEERRRQCIGASRPSVCGPTYATLRDCPFQ
jgi:hypothetical protein